MDWLLRSRGMLRWRLPAISATLSFGVVVVFLLRVSSNCDEESFHRQILDLTSTRPRKLLATGVHPMADPSEAATTKRIGAESCTKDDILVYQGATAPLPNGIPTYTVQILNTCPADGCAVSDIHVSCGWFSSARLINPSVFRRLSYDDCLVNDGATLAPGESLSFQYANTYRYPLYVSSANCC